jgi:hypothetical protein
MPPDTTHWVTHITNGASARDIADRADIPLRTVQHQLSTGRVTVDAAVRIAAAFDYSPVRALIDFDVIDASWASDPDIPTALEQATTDQLVTTIHQRLAAADNIRSQLAMNTSPIDTGNGVPRARLRNLLTQVSGDPDRAMAVLNAAGLLDKDEQTLPDRLAFPTDPEARERIATEAWLGRFYLGRQQDESTGEISEAFWDATKNAHLLVSGRTGAGKSEAVETLIHAAGTCPDITEVVICAHDVHAFADAAELDVVRSVVDGTDADALARVVAEMRNEVDDRLRPLPDTALGTLFDSRGFPVHWKTPKRLVLVIDNMPELLAADGDAARSATLNEVIDGLTSIACRGRDAAVNIVAAGQKFDSAITPPVLTDNFFARLGMGPMDAFHSTRILHDDHAARLPGSTPTGRGWLYDPTAGYRLVQVADSSGQK